MNALNMADGLDGLAAGNSARACIFLGYFAFTSGQLIYLYVLFILFGSLLGFLYYNKYPAKIFMGDIGSLVLGYILSAICILLVQDTNNEFSVLPISMAIVMGLPIVDALLVMINRIIHGKSPFKPDKTHLHDRLLSLGLEHKDVVLVMYIFMFACGSLSVCIAGLQDAIQFAIGVLFAIIIFMSVYIMQMTGF